MEKKENEKEAENKEENIEKKIDKQVIEETNIKEDKKEKENKDRDDLTDDKEINEIEKNENKEKNEEKEENTINKNNIENTEKKNEIENDKENNNNEKTEQDKNSNQQNVTIEIIQPKENSLTDNYNPNTYEFPKDFMEDKIRCNTLTQKLIAKTKINSNLKYEEFFTKKRHYLIMSDGGKPVYSRYGDPIENNSIFATLSAMITKYTIFNTNDNEKENLNVITNNKNKIVFLKKGQLIFIALSKKNDCTSLLFSQLEYLYFQLMSILTISFYSKLEDNPSKCLSTMGGTENLFEQMIQYTSKSFPALFNSYQVFNYFELREKLNKLAEEFRGDALYCIIMTPYEIISLSRSNQIDVVPSDLVLIQNLIYSQEMLRTQESYVPICLPGISEQGYIQFYSNFSEENIGIIFITENMDPLWFVKFQEQYNKLYQKLLNENYIEKIIENFRINNNISGEYSLIKKHEEKKEEEISTEILLEKLVEKIGKNNNKIFNFRDSIKRADSISDYQGKIEKVKNKYFEGVKYGVVLNKKYKQYILFNFDMDFRVFDKTEKKLIHEYNILYDKEISEVNENEEFFFIKKSNEFINVIEANEFLLCIFTFNFFLEYDEVGKKSKELIKYIKKNENKFFILFK